MKHIRSLAVATLALGALSFTVVAHAKLARNGGASVKFHADTNVPMLSIDGSTSQLSLSDDGSNLTISVPMGTLSTGLGPRDTHMKNALEVDKYPTAQLTVARSALKLPAQGASANGSAQGSLTLHGQTKNVSFSYTASRDDKGYHVTTSAMTVNMGDFGIEVKKSSLIPASVKPNVGIVVTFDANE